MDRRDRPSDHRRDAARTLREDRGDPGDGDQDLPLDPGDEEDGADFDAGGASEARRTLLGQEGFPENPDAQSEFREQFDEDLYNDREDRPAQGNTADVAMGDQRFGSEADAYSEYAWRRPGDHHSGDASAVGQARDPADISDEDERP